MKNMLLILVTFIFTCKDGQQIPMKSDKINFSEKKEVNDEIEISICNEKKRDNALYKEFIKSGEISYKDKVEGTFYYGAGKEAVDSLFKSENIDCVVALSGDGYAIFDMHYNDNLAEDVYEGIVAMNKTMQGVDAYHDFFKRGLVFILNRPDKKLTMISFNPFLKNDLPKEIAAYFHKNRTDFDKVVRIIGVGQLKVLVE